VGGVGPGAGYREVDAAELQLLDGLRVIGQLAGRIDLDLVTALGVLGDLLAEQLCRHVARTAGLVGVAKLERGRRGGRQGKGKGRRDAGGDQAAGDECSAFHDVILLGWVS
jgi:hypothetical protein